MDTGGIYQTTCGFMTRVNHIIALTLSVMFELKYENKNRRYGPSSTSGVIKVKESRSRCDKVTNIRIQRKMGSDAELRTFHRCNSGGLCPVLSTWYSHQLLKKVIKQP